MIGLVDGNNFFVSCERVVDPALNGHAVAVMSNNDGCCVSRSNEFKALGIPMGTPRFKLRNLESSGQIKLLSSNFELYGDLSSRMMSVLRENAVEVEQYSIDEAFIYPPTTVRDDLEDYGLSLREKVLRQVGIPCGVGFAPTKTLAKIANHIAKKSASGVYVLPADTTELLASLPVGEVWGVGRHLVEKLSAERITTAAELCAASSDLIRRVGGLSLLRTVSELRGEVALSARDYDVDPASITYSRSFGNCVINQRDLVESIVAFAARASEKLRRHSMMAAGCLVYAQYGATLDRTFLSRTVVFPIPTDATNQIVAALVPAAKSLFIPDYVYRKSGITFFGLASKQGIHQDSLFDELPDNAALISQRKNSSRLFSVVDALNARFGRGTVKLAATGLRPEPVWEMKKEKLSKRATTNWNELITVR